MQSFLEGVAITQASKERTVYGLGGGAEVVVLGEGQGMSWHSRRSSRVQNLGSPGLVLQRTSRWTFVGGSHCRSMVELLGNVGGVFALWEGVGDGKVDAEVEPEVELVVDAKGDAVVDAEVDVEVDLKVDVEVELDGEVAP